MKKLLNLSLFCLVITIMCFTLGKLDEANAASDNWKPERKFLTIVSSSAGGSWYAIGAKIAEIIHKEIPEITVKIAPGGGVNNIKAVQSGTAQLGFTFSNTVFDGYKGEAPFKKSHNKLRHVMNIFPAYFQIVVPQESTIRSVADVAGKSVAPGGPIGYSGEAISRDVLDVYGLNYDKIKDAGGIVNFIRYEDMVNLMQDGHLDAAFMFTIAPNASILNLNIRPGIKLIPIETDKLTELLEKKPGFYKSTVKANTYEGQNKDIQTFGAWTTLFASADLSDELVYRIAKAVFDNIQELYAIGVTTKYMAVEVNYEGNKIPVHPGAELYYKEKGVRP